MKKSLLYFSFFCYFFLNAIFVNAQTQFQIGSASNVSTATVTIPITVTDFTQLIGIQGSINWDNSKLTYNSITNNTTLSGLTSSNSTSGTTGRLGYFWTDAAAGATPQTLANNTVLFNLVLNVVSGATGTTTLTFSNSPTLPLVADNNTNIATGIVYSSGTVTFANSLPLTWLSFTAKNTNCNSILLQWQTANEINNKGFNIEYSQDGITYNTANFVQANNNNKYNYTITNLQDGIYYLRLKQIDKDGKFEYSTILQSSINCNKASIIIYPNPAKDKVIVRGESISKIKLMNRLGQVLFEQNNLTANQKIIDIQKLQRGIYILQVVNNGVLITDKLMIE